MRCKLVARLSGFLSTSIGSTPWYLLLLSFLVLRNVLYVPLLVALSSTLSSLIAVYARLRKAMPPETLVALSFASTILVATYFLSPQPSLLLAVLCILLSISTLLGRGFRSALDLSIRVRESLRSKILIELGRFSWIPSSALCIAIPLMHVALGYASVLAMLSLASLLASLLLVALKPFRMGMEAERNESIKLSQAREASYVLALVSSVLVLCMGMTYPYAPILLYESSNLDIVGVGMVYAFLTIATFVSMMVAQPFVAVRGATASLLLRCFVLSTTLLVISTSENFVVLALATILALATSPFYTTAYSVLVRFADPSTVFNLELLYTALSVFGSFLGALAWRLDARLPFLVASLLSMFAIIPAAMLKRFEHEVAKIVALKLRSEGGSIELEL